MFADDTNLLIIKDNVLQHKVKDVMKKLKYLFKKNNHRRNVGKTVAMSFYTEQISYKTYNHFQKYRYCLQIIIKISWYSYYSIFEREC